MWFSGNNPGYFAGPAITTSYGDNDVPMHNDGSPHEPMFTHLQWLHAAFQSVARVMLCQEAPQKRFIGPPHANVYVYEYGACGSDEGSGGVDFVVNRNISAPAKLTFKGATLTIAPMSLVMLQDGKVTYRTDDVPSGKYADRGFRNAGVVANPWRAWRETMPDGDGGGDGTRGQSRSASGSGRPVVGEVVTADHAVEQLSLTNDSSPYLWYEVDIPGGKASAERKHTLTLQTLNAQAFVVFVDGRLVADTYDSTDGLQDDGVVLGCNFSVVGPAPQHRLSILSSSLGVQNFYPPGYCMWKGLAGGNNSCRNHPDSVAGQVPPLLDGEPMEGPGWTWTMRPRLQGEWLNIMAATPEHGAEELDRAPPVEWSATEARLHQPKTWFETSFLSPPNATGPAASVGVHLNLTGFGRGFAWVNGRNIGRYWNVTGSCSPPGAWNTFCEDFDDDFCGQPSQGLYHVPAAWLEAEVARPNRLVLFDELGASWLDRLGDLVAVRDLL